MSIFNQPPPTYDDASRYMSTTLTPYLQLPHLLSLTWLAYPILSLIFVAFRLQLSLAASQNAIASAKDDLLTSCKAAEQAATAAASMPRYMAIATNQQFADAVNGSLRAARAALVLSLTIMETVINFIIDIYRSTLLCFLELVVRGGLAIMIGAVNELNTVIQSVTTGLRTSIQNDIASANSIITTAIDAINRVNPFGKITPPQINVPSLDGLQNVQLPASFQESLTKLNDTIPSVGEIKDKLEAIINTPFELLKKDINETFAGISFNSSALPIPEQNKLSFCSNLDTSVVDDIGRDIVKSAKIGAVILIVIALLLIGFNCLLTWYKWRCMKAHLEYTRQAWMTDPNMVHNKGSSLSGPQITLSDHNLMMLQANSEHPLITRITNQMSSRLGLSPSQHAHMQWFFNYIFHPPAAACFLIGFFGLILVEIQLLAMGPMVARYQGRAADTVRDFSTLIATSINDSMYNQSAAYASQVNGRVDVVQTTINDGLFGWVNGTTTTLNTTINEFYNDVQTAVTTVFGGTILETPANEFIKCLIGSKVDAIENALTFLHDNLKVDMPRVNDTVLILSPEAVNEASAPIAAAAIGGGPDNKEGLVGRLVNSYADSLRKERITFGIFLALWGFVVLMGICVVLWHSFIHPLIEKRRRRRYQLEQRGGLPDGLIVPYRSGSTTPPRQVDEKWDGGMAVTKDLPSFTPLPSPRRSVFRPFWASRANTPVYEEEDSQEQFKSANSAEGLVVNAEGDNKKTSRLRAIRMKLSGKGNTNRDQEDLSEQRDQGMGSNDKNGKGWLGRMTGTFGKKEPEPEHDFWESFNSRPKLKIIVDTASDKFAMERPREEMPSSRWSASPDATQTSWKNILSPTKKPAMALPAAPSPVTSTTLSPSKPPRSLPPPPPQLRHKASVPSDIGGSYDDPFLGGSVVNPKPSPIVPAAYPIPLHAVYDGSSSLAASRAPIPPPSQQVVLPPPPPPRLNRLPSTNSSDSGHQRVSSVPVWRVTNLMPSDQMSNHSNASLPEGRGRQQPVSLNPFITPFDDEHRVQMVTPAPSSQRKSIPINPFTAVAI